jgi:GldM C-terminal domain
MMVYKTQGNNSFLRLQNMKKLHALAALCLLFSTAALAQNSNPKVVVEIPECNKVWVGVSNHLKIMVEGQDSVSLDQIKVTNATITKEGDYFDLQPKEVGTVEMTVTTTSHTDKHVFRAKPIEVTPLYGAQYANGTIMGNGAFKAQGGLTAVVTCCGFEAKCDVVSYQIIRIAADGSMTRVVNQGIRFGPEAQAIVMQARPGDTYLFFDIQARCPGDAADRNLGTVQIGIR